MGILHNQMEKGEKTMIIDIPLFMTLNKTRHTLRFVDVDKERYNIMLVIEIEKGDKWEYGSIQLLGYAKKLDIKRLAKAS